MMNPQEQLERIKRRTVEIIPEGELLQKLRRSYETGKPLRVKLGVDPTAPDIHLGHTVVLRKLRDFQELGHIAVLIVGDFTARIGDPSGRKTTRPVLSPEEIERNVQTYKEQVFKILDPDPERVEIRYNSEWLEPMTFADVLKLTSKYTVARLLERDDFAQRLQEGLPITVLELLYPLAQAYDSVAVRADVELGGTDQRFNLLVGREIQERYGQEPQVAVIMPLLEGTDGAKKMSKSEGNYVGITEPPKEMFGKLMAIPDTLIEKYVQLLTDLDWEALRKEHPMEQKERLAFEIVRLYHGEEAARVAQEEFERVFRRRERPQDVPRVSIPIERLEDGKIPIVDLLELSGLVGSRSEARRLITQGAVELDGTRVTDLKAQVEVEDGMLLRVGKRRFAELTIEPSESKPKGAKQP
jgi:tyrosyl-tRNA synthetase